MNPNESFVRENLHYELRCLLGATTVWRIFQKNKTGFDVIVAMDAAFVHARCLFAFFTKPKNGNDRSITEFGPNQYVSSLYNTWCGALNQHVMHINKGRAHPANVINGVHLNEQVEKFAREILDLWIKFENDPLAQIYSVALREAREEAIKHSKYDACRRINPLF